MNTTVNRIAVTAVVLHLATGLALLHAGAAGAQGNPQYPMLDEVSQGFIQKYRTTTCQELAQRHQNPPAPSPTEQRIVQMLGADPALRAEFFRRVGGAILDKMFVCGLIP